MPMALMALSRLVLRPGCRPDEDRCAQILVDLDAAQPAPAPARDRAK